MIDPRTLFKRKVYESDTKTHLARNKRKGHGCVPRNSKERQVFGRHFVTVPVLRALKSKER